MKCTSVSDSPIEDHGSNLANDVLMRRAVQDRIRLSRASQAISSRCESNFTLVDDTCRSSAYIALHSRFQLRQSLNAPTKPRSHLVAALQVGTANPTSEHGGVESQRLVQDESFRNRHHVRSLRRSSRSVRDSACDLLLPARRKTD